MVRWFRIFGHRKNISLVPKPGDKLRLNISFVTPGNLSYAVGDVLELIEPTLDAPFGWKSRICNWHVKCKHHPNGSVWSMIWAALEHGYMEKIEE